MEIYTVSKRDKKIINDMASGKKPIDYSKLVKISKRFSRVRSDAVSMMNLYPENEAYKKNVEELTEIGIILMLLFGYDASKEFYDEEDQNNS